MCNINNARMLLLKSDATSGLHNKLAAVDVTTETYCYGTRRDVQYKQTENVAAAELSQRPIHNCAHTASIGRSPLLAQCLELSGILSGIQRAAQTVQVSTQNVLVCAILVHHAH